MQLQGLYRTEQFVHEAKLIYRKTENPTDTDVENLAKPVLLNFIATFEIGRSINSAF